MTNLERQHELVKNSLVQFVSAHIPGADFSVIDEIVLSYIISILEEASQDPCFDVEGFVEMMSAYFEDFSSIDQGIICDWIYKLANELIELQKNQDNNQQAANLSLKYVYLYFLMSILLFLFFKTSLVLLAQNNIRTFVCEYLYIVLHLFGFFLLSLAIVHFLCRILYPNQNYVLVILPLLPKRMSFPQMITMAM